MTPGSLEDLLARLEAVLGRLADGGAPLDRVVADHEEASRLLEEAETRFRAIAAEAQAQAGAAGEGEAQA